jgi:hypothetical protein
MISGIVVLTLLYRCHKPIDLMERDVWKSVLELWGKHYTILVAVGPV